MNFSTYTTKSVEEVFSILKTSEDGISNEEAGERIKTYGFNEIRAKETGFFDIFLRQFKSPFFYLLFIAAVLAFLIGEKIDGILILCFVFINVLLGFFQEARAHRAISLLRKYLPEKIKVLRKGIEKEIEKNFLVPGDIVLLGAGDIAPADLRVLEINNFMVDESVLTGESAPVAKISNSLQKETKEVFEAKNIIFSGTSVISGKTKGIVINTGRNTVFGKITKLVAGIKKESVYEKNLGNFSQLILRIVVVTIVFVYLANLIIKGGRNLLEFSIFSIALIVTILPEALPLVVTFSLSSGSLKLAKKKVVVKRLVAIEDLGDIEILCIDKTGTITENKLQLDEIFAKDKEKCLSFALFASSACEKFKSDNNLLNPFDSALFQKSPENIKQSLKKIRIISEIPFDSFRLRNSVLLQEPEGKRILVVRGAPEVILKLSSGFDGNLPQEVFKKEMERKGSEGKRILAVAFKEFEKNNLSEDDEKDLIFLGYFCFKDPLKATAKATIQSANKLGVKVKILTGDSKEIAGFVGKEIGLIKDPQKVITGEELDALPEEEFEKKCEEFSVFARVSPQTKYKIVLQLAKRCEVGFLGEGLNDAPALKAAHLGIAVKEATDIAKDVADIILLEKDLGVIIGGIEEGRNIFSNINKYIKTALSSNFGNFYSIAFISLFIPFLPILPTQALLVNLLSDFPLITVSSDRVDPEELRKPKFYQLNNFISLIVLLALVSTVFDFIFFAISKFIYHNKKSCQPLFVEFGMQ